MGKCSLIGIMAKQLSVNVDNSRPLPIQSTRAIRKVEGRLQSLQDVDNEVMGLMLASSKCWKGNVLMMIQNGLVLIYSTLQIHSMSH